MSPQEARNHRKYGVPIYGASWLPAKVIFNQQQQPKKLEDESVVDGDGDESPVQSVDSSHYIVLSGGGGEGKTGIRNALLVAHFDSAVNCLSDQPVSRLETSGDLPYRLAVHPGGEGLICGMPNSCRWYEWNSVKNGDDGSKVGVRTSEKELEKLEGAGQQLAMSFNKDGSMLALGDENGHLRVYKWPSMETIIDEPKAHSSVKDLDFSSSGNLLVSSGGGGPCRIWDLTSAAVVASLSKQNDEVFGLCKFSTSEMSPVLYTTVKHGKGGSIVTWETKSWKRIRSKNIAREPISALSVSSDGTLIAVGTAEGDVLVLNSTTMRVQTVVRKAHFTVVTAMGFSETSRDLMSTSMDSSVRVTVIREKKNTGFSVWNIVFIIILGIAAYILNNNGMISEETWTSVSSHFRN